MKDNLEFKSSRFMVNNLYYVYLIDRQQNKEYKFDILIVDKLNIGLEKYRGILIQNGGIVKHNNVFFRDAKEVRKVIKILNPYLVMWRLL